MVRGLDGIRTVDWKLGSVKLKLGVAHGLANARKLCKQAAHGESEYGFDRNYCLVRAVVLPEVDSR